MDFQLVSAIGHFMTISIPRFIVMMFCVWLAFMPRAGMAGHPFRGSAQWSVLLCNYQDSPAVPARSKADIEDMLVNAGNGGLPDFYSAVSRGALVMSQSAVQGWFKIPMTVADVRAFSHGGPGGDRNRSFQLCVDAARAGGYVPPAGNSVAVVTSPEIDLWGGGGGRAFLGVNHEVSAFAHEISHGLGLNHSHSDDVDFACGGALTEYHDPFDVMSWACETQVTNTARFGAGGPGFNAFHLDRMGWLQRGEILVFGADGNTNGTVGLTALYRFGFGGTRLVRIPYDPADLNRYFTVELRMAGGWDAGFGTAQVLIHDSRENTLGEHRSFLQRSSVNGPPAQTLTKNGVSIQVLGINVATGTAQVQISSNLPTLCLLGFVWREANSSDRVCVSGTSRDQARAENNLTASRRSPNGGPFGPNTCLPGFVWREANASDQVCVPGNARSRVKQENLDGPARVNPARIAFGPNTCQPGFVHREADDRDWVCVPGATRTETAQENSLAASRRVGNTNTCKQGFVWREAYIPDDRTCVSGTSRARARADNAAADSRRMPF
jgi:hypothetical protein